MREVNTVEDFCHELIDFKIIPPIPQSKTLKEYIFMKPFRELDVYFRGQSVKHTTVNCGLSRTAAFVKNESHMYHETLDIKGEYFEGLATPIEFLSKMQHYGIPTRLVDFSINPLIALFFAVLDADPEKDATVFAYKGCGRPISDLSIQIISVLPELKVKTVQAIQEKVLELYGESVTEQMVLNSVGTSQFIRFSKDLRRSNPRLFNQEGTFAICGNRVVNGMISDELCTVQNIAANLVIRIPGIYKQSIKEDLARQFEIDNNLVYPELASWSEYIRRKYDTKDFDPNGTYSAISEKDISLPDVKRLEIILVLNQEVGVDNIKKCVRDAVFQRQNGYDVVTFRVAKNGSDYGIANYVIEGHWISENTTERQSPAPLSQFDSDRFYWELGMEVSERSDYFDGELFKDNKDLFIAYFSMYSYVYPYFQQLSTAYDIMDFECFIRAVQEREHIIQTVCENLSNLGRAKSNDFDSYLKNYLDFVIALCDITFWYKLPDEVGSWLDYRIFSCLAICRKAINLLEQDKQRWMKIFDISCTDLEMKNFSPKTKALLQFKQTKPVADNAINVAFDLEYFDNDEEFILSGKTNLFDYCSLDLTFNAQHGRCFIQCSTIIKNGVFEYRLNRKQLVGRKYNIMLSVSFPRKQDGRFTEWAGDEYEHLKGPYIQRGGIDTTITFLTDMDISQAIKHTKP